MGGSDGTVFSQIWSGGGAGRRLCAAPAFAQAPAPAPVRGGALTIGVESDFEGFDPIRAGVYSNSTVTAASLFYETLMRLDDKGNLLPALALSMTPNEDGSVWTAKIRPNVKWHDGTPFTAQAVADHFNRLLDPANRFAGRAYLAIEKVEVPDELTAVFKMRGPNAALPRTLAQPTVTTLIIPVKQRPGEGRRLQPQSRRHRPVRLQGMARRRPADRRAQSRLLGQGQALSRPRDRAAAARFRRPLRQPGEGRRPGDLGRSRREHRQGQEGQEPARADLGGQRRAGHAAQHPARAAERQARAPGRLDGAEPQGQRRGAEPGPASRP